MSQNKSYSNQKTIFLPIHINYTTHFTRFRNEVLFSAAKNLKKTSFYIWIYLCCFLKEPQKDNPTPLGLDLTPTKVCNVLGISKPSYYSALKELNEKKYLITSSAFSLLFFALPYKASTDEGEQLGAYDYSSKQNIVRAGKLYLQKVGDNNYTPLSHDQIFDKIKNLSFGAFMVWLYLRSLPPGSIFLSKVATCEKTGLNEDQYLKGVNELIKEGILKQEKEFSFTFVSELMCKEKKTYKEHQSEEKEKKKKKEAAQVLNEEDFEPLQTHKITEQEKQKSQQAAQTMAERWLI